MLDVAGVTYAGPTAVCEGLLSLAVGAFPNDAGVAVAVIAGASWH